MKKYLLVLAPLFAVLLFTQCQKDEVSPDLMLITEIEKSANKVNIDPRDLPPPILDQIEEEFFETYIETAAHVPGKGYEVVMATEDILYFRENGEALGRERGQIRPHRSGPCGHGMLIRPSELPAAIVEYIDENYPDAEILRAKHFRQRGYIVMISDRRLLVFNIDLEFVTETTLFYFCKEIGQPVQPINLPPVIQDYIDANYPGATVFKAERVRGHIIVGIATSGGRLILVFDMEGNFLFSRG